MKVIFDLDGTLANTEHRADHVTGETKDWRAFYAACVDDKPIWPTILTLKSMARDPMWNVEIWTGRSDEVEEETLKWLARFGIYVRHHSYGIQEDGRRPMSTWEDLPSRSAVLVDELWMRAEGDHRHDTDLKEEWLKSDAFCGNRAPVDLVFEDRARVVAMWRRNGIVCHQVAPGDF